MGVALAAGGCGEPWRLGSPPPGPGAGAPIGATGGAGASRNARRGGPADPDVVVVHLQFEVMRAVMPVTTTRHSTKIWNHVDELQLDPRRCALLARNGLRIGVADEDAWPAIDAILKAHEARSQSKQHAVQHDSPLTLDVGEVRDGETIFSYDADGHLKGHTFGPGRKYIHIACAVSPENPQQIALKVLPEVHVESLEKHWDQVGGGIQERTRYQGRVFSELTAALTATSGQILVIGPSTEAELPCLVGSRFLEDDTGGLRSETIIFARPRLYRTGTTEP